MNTKLIESKKNNIPVILLSIILILLSISVLYVYLSRPKIAFVRNLELVYGYNGMKEAHSEFKAQAANWQSNIDTLQMQYRKSAASFQQNYNTYSKKEKEEQQAMLDRMEHDMKNYTSVVHEQAEDREKKLTEGVLNQINSFVQKYAKEKGYDMVFGADGNGSLLHGNDKYDITEEVLKALNQEYKLMPADKLK